MDCPNCQNRLVPHGRGKNTTLLCNKCGKKHALGSLNKSAFDIGFSFLKTEINRVKKPTPDAEAGRHSCAECNGEGQAIPCKRCNTVKTPFGSQRVTKPSQRNNKNYTILRSNIEKKREGDPCWNGYEQVGMKMKNGRSVPNCVPIKGVKKSCGCATCGTLVKALISKKKDKPFHGYNPNKHSRKGGLNAKGRAKAKREEGANLKPPVTTKPSKLKPGSKKAKRRKSFCARMGGVKGPTSKGGKMTPKGAALKRWNC